jgi:class 3 adenylate cyclase
MPGTPPDVIDKRAEQLREDWTPQTLLAFREANRRTDVTRTLPLIQAPTMVVPLSGGSGAQVNLVREIASAIPDARFLNTRVSWNELDDETLHQTLMFLGAAAAVAPRRLADKGSLRTVLFTDLVGHTEMMQRLGDERGRDVLREHERITREVLKANGGTEVKTMGDGFMASFGSVTKAVECAIALQQAIADWNASLPARPEALEGRAEQPRLAVRVGLNAGEPIEEDGDLFGATVILASRIAAKAEGGEILVADTVRGLCSGKGFLFADRGEFVAKGFEEPVRVYEVRWRE